MIISTHSSFDKMYAKLPVKVKQKFKDRRDLFLSDVFHPQLNNHALIGKHEGYRSINIGGDYRALFKYLNSDSVIFIAIGTHSQLYG